MALLMLGLAFSLKRRWFLGRNEVLVILKTGDFNMDGRKLESSPGGILAKFQPVFGHGSLIWYPDLSSSRGFAMR
jgi:hypothetical protein